MQHLSSFSKRTSNEVLWSHFKHCTFIQPTTTVNVYLQVWSHRLHQPNNVLQFDLKLDEWPCPLPLTRLWYDWLWLHLTLMITKALLACSEILVLTFVYSCRHHSPNIHKTSHSHRPIYLPLHSLFPCSYKLKTIRIYRNII